MDVEAVVDGLTIVLEAETGYHRTAQAIKDADARLRQGIAIIAFAVCYPSDVTEENMAQASLRWTLRTVAGSPNAQWYSGGVAELARAVLQSPAAVDDADAAARILSRGLDEVVQGLDTPTRRALARALDLPAGKPVVDHSANGWFVPAKRGMLVVATAMLFHHRVQSHLPALRPSGYNGPWPPYSPDDCINNESTLWAFSRAWEGILAVDYRPVFETGRKALGALPSHPQSALMIKNLAIDVGIVSNRVAGMRHDLLGRIFHRVLDTARYDGSFYTSTAAAVLLASLALREKDLDWSDANAVADLKICDPACGTGTLLMAASERIRALRMAAGRLDREDEEALGLYLVEDVLWGYDVNLTATHMAASTIGMLSPKTSFSRMNIHRAILGVQEEEAHLGSLDFLAGKPQLAMWPSPFTQQVENGEGNGRTPPPMDLVIMNPPFTRDSLRHDQFSKDEEKAIKEREKEMLDNLAKEDNGDAYGQLFRAAARLSGSANSFMVLGDKMTKDENGTLAVVLPTVMATNPASRSTRQYLAQRFHIETIVSSHDPQRIFFSENTSIGEILLVCRRWNGSDSKPPTNVINLVENPGNAFESLDVANRIAEAIRRGSAGLTDYFTLQQVEEERIRNGDWSAVNFLSPFLVQAHRSLTEDNIACVPMVPLEHLAEVGPEGRRVRDSYTRLQRPTLSGHRALWFHKTDVTQSMQAETDVFIEPKEAKRHLADRYWEQRGRMLLPHRLRLNLTRAVSVMLPSAALGSAWTPCRPHQPEISEAICLYLNSSVGILSLLGDRDNRVPSYPNFSLDTLRSILVPDFTALGDSRLQTMRNCFELLKTQTLLPFPRMKEDPVRQEIDACVSEALDLDRDWLEDVRNNLCFEPAITQG